MNIDFVQLTYSVTSVLFTTLFVIIGEFLFLICKWKHENTRKFIHIGVCHWWIFASCTIDNTFYATLPPILFFCLNLASYKWKLVKSIERNRGREDLGTVYYALSLILLVVFTWHNVEKRNIAAIGILILGYGDGLAAIIGKNFPIRPFIFGNNKKTISGTITMFVVSYIVAYICLCFYKTLPVYTAIYLAIIATMLELITPWGFDNLTIPLGVTLLGICL